MEEGCVATATKAGAVVKLEKASATAASEKTVATRTLAAMLLQLLLQ